jgi:hypothetical protein
MFACPSPKNTNHAGLFLTRAGHLLDKHGRDWGRSSMGRMAFDELPELSEAQRGEIDEDERLKALCHELELAMEKLNLRPEYVGALLQVIEKHKGHDWRESAKAGDDLPESVRAPTSDEIDDLDDFRQHLRARGLDEKSIKQACDLVRWQRGQLVNDRLPVAGPGGLGGYRSGQSRQPGEKVFPYATDRGTVRPRASARFAEMFPDAARIQTGGGGYSQFDADHARLTERRQLAADAAPAAEAASVRPRKALRKRIPGIENIGVGPWVRRV